METPLEKQVSHTRIAAPRRAVAATAACVAWVAAATSAHAIPSADWDDTGEVRADVEVAQLDPLDPLDRKAAVTAEGEESEEGDESSGSFLPFGVTASMGTRASLGQLFRDPNTITNSAALNFGLGLTYPITDQLMANMNFGYSKFVTPHGLDTIYEGRFTDPLIGITAPSVYTIPVLGIRVGAGGAVVIPVTEISRTQRLFTTLSGNIGLSRGFGPVNLSYSLSVSKSFNRYTNTVLDARELDIFARIGGPEQVAQALVADTSGILTEWTVSNAMSLGYRTPVQGLSTNLVFSLVDAFSYREDSIMEADAFTSEFARVGRGRSQFMSGAISVSYSFLGHYAVTTALATSQLPKTFDNRRVRFPFWDTQSGNLQFTSVGMTLSASF
jgi:hypothetical protein